MKALAFFSCLLAGSAACAAVTSDATFGVLKVASTNTETVICVPWVKVGDGTDIKVKDFVKTTDMTDGDELYLYDSSSEKFYQWILTDGAWKGSTSVSKVGIDTAIRDASEDTTLARGQALIVYRQNKAGTSPARPADAIYLYGQYAEIGEGGVPYTLTRGKKSLIAPPNTSGTVLSLNDETKITWTGYNPDDCIYLQSTNNNRRITITRNKNTTVDGVEGKTVNTLWVYRKWDGTETTPLATLKAGQGAWYDSKNNAKNPDGDFKVTFK